MPTNRPETGVIYGRRLPLEPDGRGWMRAVEYGRDRSAMVPA